jgi:dTDP-4-amino-4,6-dideoxygalactose transaminase
LEAPGRRHVWHLFVVRHPERDRLQAALADEGIATGLHYPVPLHLQDAYRHLEQGRGRFPEAERWASRGLSLPMFPTMTSEQVDRVCDTIRRLTD